MIVLYVNCHPEKLLYPNSPMPVARRVVDELIEFRELFDSLMCLRDDKRVESENLSLLNEMIALVGEDIATKEVHVSSG
nr:hypothetical protein [Tanacetum cinerariifolium]